MQKSDSVSGPAHLHVEVFKCHGVSPEQLHGVPGHEADSKETLHLVRARPLGHLGTRRKETGRETGRGGEGGDRDRWRVRDEEQSNKKRWRKKAQER